MPIKDFRRPFYIVLFQDNIFGGTDAAVKWQHAERFIEGEFGLIGKDRRERVRYNIGGRVK